MLRKASEIRCWRTLIVSAPLLLSMRAAHAQGYPPQWVRKMQARITDLEMVIERLDAQLNTERRQHAQERQQAAGTRRRLERLQSAVIAAAALSNRYGGIGMHCCADSQH
jgi:ribosomal protein L9